MLDLKDMPAAAADRLQQIYDTQMVVKELLRLSKERQALETSSQTIEFQPGDLVYLSTRGLRIKSQSCKKLMDRRLGPYKILEKVGNRSYRLQLEQGSRLHPVFHVDVLSKAMSNKPLRPQPVDAVDDGLEYDVEKITDVKLDVWPRRRGPQVQFLTHYVGYEDPEWSLLELLDDTVALDNFLKTDHWASFTATDEYKNFCSKYPQRAVHV